MLEVERFALGAGIVGGKTWLVLTDSEGGLAAVCPPNAVGRGGWTAPNDPLGFEPVDAETWIDDPLHPVAISLRAALGVPAQGVLADALTYVEAHLVKGYESPAVSWEGHRFVVTARSGARRLGAGGAAARPRLRKRIDIWI